VCDLRRVLDWGDLAYLLVVARAGSLAAAARELGVEHSTVGRRLGAVEAALGARMFTRGPDGLRPTPACTAILPALEEMAAQASSIARQVSAQDARAEGTVRVTTTESQSAYFVRSLPALRERHPSLTVEIIGDNRRLDLLKGEAEIAIRMFSIDEPDLVIRKLGQLGLGLYASPSYVERKGKPPSAIDLRGHDLVTSDRTWTWPGSVWLDKHAEGATVAFRGNNITALGNAAAAGMGIAVLPCFLAADEPRLVRVASDRIAMFDRWAVTHRDLTSVARVRAVIDYFAEIVQRDEAFWLGDTA
jgi:DNA-binding transcriptional LysR family regulator